jgi:hypothetical protein
MGTRAEGAGDERIELLLAQADELRPALEEGFPRDTTRDAPTPGASPGRADMLIRDAPDTDPDDLATQRWGVIAPDGSHGNELIEAVRALIRLREDEQGAPPKIYRARPGMTAEDAVRFRDTVYAPERTPVRERPRYLLILGDLHETSIELQHVLAHSAFVGRIHFSDARGEADVAAYKAYAEKVVAFAAQKAEDEADALFFTARDGTPATAAGYHYLMRPCAELLSLWGGAVSGAGDAQSGAADDALGRALELAPDEASLNALLDAAKTSRPTLLLSLSHGLGAPRQGWRSPEEQRALQGALSLGQGAALTAEAVRRGQFLPGGMWFSVACFGAGTPSTSAFHAWIAQLSSAGFFEGRARSVLSSLPKKGDRPFVAALPQAALANPEGPLAVFGHMDLAWTYGFMDSEHPSQSRASRIASVLRTLANGSRAGTGLDALMRAFRDTNDQLLTSYQAQEDARVRGEPLPDDAKRRGVLWMIRNDLRGYVLLGDPAARLTLRGDPGSRPKPRWRDGALTLGGPADARASVKKASLEALLRGTEAPLGIAERAGVPLETLWAWFDEHRARRAREPTG